MSDSGFFKYNFKFTLENIESVIKEVSEIIMYHTEMYGSSRRQPSYYLVVNSITYTDFSKLKSAVEKYPHLFGDKHVHVALRFEIVTDPYTGYSIRVHIESDDRHGLWVHDTHGRYDIATSLGKSIAKCLNAHQVRDVSFGMVDVLKTSFLAGVGMLPVAAMVGSTGLFMTGIGVTAGSAIFSVIRSSKRTGNASNVSLLPAPVLDANVPMNTIR